MARYEHNNWWYAEEIDNDRYDLYIAWDVLLRSGIWWITVSSEILEWMWFTRVEEDKYEECAKEIEEYTKWGGSIRACKIKEILKKHFPPKQTSHITKSFYVIDDRKSIPVYSRKSFQTSSDTANVKLVSDSESYKFFLTDKE